MLRATLSFSMILIACALTGSAPVEQTVQPAAAPAPEPLNDDNHVRFLGSSGILACAWSEADVVFERAMSQLGPALEQCAEEEGTTNALWVLWVNVGPSGEIERASVPGDDQVAGSEPSDRPPACAQLALVGVQLESGPPACGSVHMLRFSVGSN